MDPVTTAPSAKSLATQAFERLRSDILGGQLRPEARLRIQALSERYGIGATAIREALSRLVTDGFVELEDQRGFCVARVSREELMDLTRTRIEVESLALRSAIESGDLEWESGILSAFHRLSKTPPPSTPELHIPWAAAHQQFHEALVAGCSSPWTRRLCRLLYDQSERYRNLAERYTSQQKRDPAIEHREMMDAAIARQADKAVALLHAHFWETTQIILQAVFGDGGQTPAKPARKARKAPDHQARGVAV
ncbi:GntR family transcriptional regulator [Variovorax ginsengisoli]|uniref:DNA-binding GntR family transcriptional regulator n=1 Tax=Variovorax ginsengisoli TaxID=363844 RepID=A0ABT9SAL0_9BURK|nr:FCD domain-containing protein [Variovorax ginsengisoli]MDP9900873.1 DNA-binding GntR family transcriptional regulator [Variovorax ginsengisoli]